MEFGDINIKMEMLKKLISIWEFLFRTNLLLLIILFYKNDTFLFYFIFIIFRIN